MSTELNIVETTLSIGGKSYPFAHMYIKQGFNCHHEFRISLNFEAFGKKWMNDPKSVIELMGEDVIVEMKNTVSGESNLFEGIVTNVSISGTHGENNNVYITGKSSTIILDGKKIMDSFTEKSLNAIVKEVIDNAVSGVSVNIDPAYTETIDYLCQYNETGFEFLNRLSWIYGEWFYYTGSAIKFGKGKSSADDDVELVYDENMIEFKLSANLLPAKFNRYNYLAHQDKEITATAPDSVPGLRGYLKTALERSDSIYKYEGDLPVQAPVLSQKDLDTLVLAERSRDVGRMLTIEGSSRTCAVQLGKNVKVKMPQSMDISNREVDTFMITHLEHHIDESGFYSNSFLGIISDMSAVPMAEPPMPLPAPQIATVKDNADSKGRIKVQLQWQKASGKTTFWIRVQTPDAGNSENIKVNRGLVFVPEIGDQVLINFEYGDPSRPYMSGALFSEKAGVGGGDKNYIKTIITSSGNTIQFDDQKGSVTIKDKTGTDSVISLDGEGNITVSANKGLKFLCGGVSLTTDGTDASLTASKLTITASEALSLSGKTVSITAKDKLDVSSTTETTVGSSGKTTVSGQASTTVTAVGKTVVEGAIIQFN
jgi:type VI secretion system secreted protein VgrG